MKCYYCKKEAHGSTVTGIYVCVDCLFDKYNIEKTKHKQEQENKIVSIEERKLKLENLF